MLSLKKEKSQKSGGNGRFGRLAAAYCLASYSYELYSNDNYFFSNWTSKSACSVFILHDCFLFVTMPLLTGALRVQN